MDTYTIESSDNQQFELTVEQVNKYPVLRGTLTDIDAEPGSTLYIPFPSDLLIIAFNDNYNQPMDLDQLLKVIQLASYLGLEEEVDTLLRTLVLYSNQKFTAPQVEMIKYEIEAFDSIMLELLLSKTSNMETIAILDYHGSFPMTTAVNVTDYALLNLWKSAEVVRPSANLDYTLIEFASQDVGSTYISNNYSIWHKNKVTVTEIPGLTEKVRLLGTLNKSVPKDSIYISNDGQYYELEQPEEGVLATSYNIVPLLTPDEPAISAIPIPDYTETSIEKVLISVDKSKYMIRYDLLPTAVRRRLKPSVKYMRRTFIGSVAEPHKVVSFDETGNDFYFSPLFNTIIFISTRNKIKYRIYHIENNQISYKPVTSYKPVGWESTFNINRKFYFSYDGKMIAEVTDKTYKITGEITDTIVRILNARGKFLAQKEMPQYEQSVAINNKYLITYNTDSHELRFWSIDGLTNALNPTFAINTLINKEISPIIDYRVYKVKVIMGQNNTFLLTRNIIKTTKGIIKEKFFEWTKFIFSPYDTMDHFYASLTE